MLDTRAPVIGNHAKVVVCGTATGGSFSGAFIDLGYLAQEALGLAQDTHPGDRIFAVMLLPPKQIMNTQNPGEQLKANTYGALVEGEYYNRGDTQYHERWPGKARPFTRNVPPFGYTYFISQEYRFGTFNPIAKLDGLYQLASLKLFCDLIGLEGMRSGILVNHFAQGRPNKFTFGLGAIMHPRYQISEFAACKLGVQLCERLLNEKEYQDKESRSFPVPSQENQAGRTRKEWEGVESNNFEGLLRKGLNQLEARATTLGNSLQTKVERDVQRAKEDMGDLANSFLDAGDTYYGIVNMNLDSATEFLVQKLETGIFTVLEETQSLPYAIAYAGALRDTIQRTLNFWNALGIPEDSKEWNRLVTQEHIPRIKEAAQVGGENVKNLLTTRDELCAALIFEALDDLKMHLLSKRLNAVKKRIKDIVDDKLVRYRRMLERSQRILEARAREVDADLKDDTLPIARIWSKNNKEEDLKVLYALFPQPGAKDIAGTDYDPGQETRWIATALGQWYDKDDLEENSLEAKGVHPARKIKQAYQDRLLTHAEKVLTIDIKRTNYKEYINRYFKRVQRGNLKYDDYGTPIVVSRALIGSDETTNEVIDDVNALLQEQVSARLALPNMDHFLIYYREEAFEEIQQLDDFETLKYHFENAPEIGIDPEIRASWKELRVAYDAVDKIEIEERIGSDETTNEVIDDVNALLQEQVSARLALPNMDHFLIYYREEAFEEIQQLDDFETLKYHFENAPEIGIDPEIRASWKELRVAYDAVDKIEIEERARRLKDLFRFVGDFFVVWDKQPSGEWLPTNERAGIKLPIAVGMSPTSNDTVATWTVSLQHRVDKSYEFITTDGEPNEQVVKDLAQDEKVTDAILSKAIAEVQQWGYEKLEALWESEIKHSVHARYAPGEEENRRKTYFGDPQNGAADPGMLHRIVNDRWP